MVYFYLPVFSIVTKHIKWHSLSKRVIHELSEVMNFNQLTTFDFDVPRKFLNHGTIARMGMKIYHRNVLSASLYLSERSLSLSLSLSLVECYFQLNQLLLFRVLDGLT